MKKKLILVTAAAMMLASCGGNNNNGSSQYVTEPEVKAELKVEDAAKKLTTVAKNLSTSTALGIHADGGLEISTENKVTKDESLGIDRDYGSSVSASLKDLSLDLNMSGLVGVSKDSYSAADFRASLGLSGKVSASLVSNSPTYVVESDDYKLSYLDLNEKLPETALNLKTYLDGGYLYADVDESLNKVVQFFLKTLGGMGLTLGEESSLAYTGKIKAEAPESLIGGLATINVTLSSALGSFAVALAEGAVSGAFASFASASDSSLASLFSFKEYVNGTYGFTCDLDFATLIKYIAGGADAESAIGNLKGSFQFALNFDESKILSFGVSADLNSNNVTSAYSSKIAVKGGAKVSFAYGNDVKVEQVTDKDSYKDLTPSVEPEEE